VWHRRYQIDIDLSALFIVVIVTLSTVLLLLLFVATELIIAIPHAFWGKSSGECGQFKTGFFFFFFKFQSDVFGTTASNRESNMEQLGECGRVVVSTFEKFCLGRPEVRYEIHSFSSNALQLSL